MQNLFFGKGNVVWSEDKPIMVQIGEMIRDLGDKFGETMWGYFKEFKTIMHKRERIPTGIVKKNTRTPFAFLLILIVALFKLFNLEPFGYMLWVMRSGQTQY